MGQNFFTYLPSEIIINILLRLPIRTTMSCKCVCKPWLDLLVTPEFVKSHLSKSVPGLAIFDWKTEPKTNKIIEFEDEVDEHCWNVVLNFDLPFYDTVRVHSSANGLFFLYPVNSNQGFFLCNPVTREYITILPPPRSSEASFRLATYGFGVSRMSDQFKVVRMFLEVPLTPDFESDQLDFECHVYTVGTGSWRRIACDKLLNFMNGVFLNGNIHWLASNGSSARVSCLDLETELFSNFSPPPPPPCDDDYNNRTLSVLGDFLCVCDTFDYGNYGIDIWLMKEYGKGKSWKKEFVIKFDIDDFLGDICPIKVFKDGDILMELNKCMLHYSCKSETIREIDMSGFDRKVNYMIVYAPTFLSLKTFAMENVSSF